MQFFQNFWGNYLRTNFKFEFLNFEGGIISRKKVFYQNYHIINNIAIDNYIRYKRCFIIFENKTNNFIK